MNRKGFIGGSDLYTIMKGDWHDLWLVKTGRKEPENLDHIFRVQLGTYTEQFNLRWLARDTGLAIQHLEDQYVGDESVVQYLSGVPFKGQIDAKAVDEQGEPYIIECKHTSSNRNMDDMLDSYMPQIQLYMNLFTTNKAYLSVIFGNTHDYRVVDYDGKYLNAVCKRAKEFWHLVETDTEPSHDISSWKIDWSSVKINGLKARDASQDNYFTSLASDFVNTMEDAKAHDKAKKELKELIRDDEREVFCKSLSIKRDKRGACRINVL